MTCGPGGVVGEYVPFYFVPRNSMMYGLHKQGANFARSVFLVSSVERLRELGARAVVSNRNAALDTAEFVTVDSDLDAHVDWHLMSSSSWGYDPQDPERPERRMAECLVHEQLPLRVFERIVVRSDPVLREVEDVLSAADIVIDVDVGRHWYF